MGFHLPLLFTTGHSESTATSSWRWLWSDYRKWKSGHRVWKQGRIFVFSKIAVGGALTLQVLLMWTVISLGGFPANCPHHPSLPQTHTSKHSQRPYLQNLLFISQENHRRGNAAAGRPLLCVWIFWSSSKMKSMWWKWPDINKPSGHKPIQQIPCDLCLHSVLCSFFKDF